MIKFTHAALSVMTEKQKETILNLTKNDHEITITSHDFSLPSDWLSFALTYHNSDTAIYGGIGPDGDAHTFLSVVIGCRAIK